tara:strand:- start:723 stop:860 length:138 start_codon:yes stop_codon:yes gene_type:complete
LSLQPSTPTIRAGAWRDLKNERGKTPASARRFKDMLTGCNKIAKN